MMVDNHNELMPDSGILIGVPPDQSVPGIEDAIQAAIEEARYACLGNVYQITLITEQTASRAKISPHSCFPE